MIGSAFQVDGRGAQQCWVIPEARETEVAFVAQQPAHTLPAGAPTSAAAMIVVDVPAALRWPSFGARLTRRVVSARDLASTDGAAPELLLKQLRVMLKRETVRRLEVRAHQFGAACWCLAPHLGVVSIPFAPLIGSLRWLLV